MQLNSHGDSPIKSPKHYHLISSIQRSICNSIKFVNPGSTLSHASPCLGDLCHKDGHVAQIHTEALTQHNAFPVRPFGALVSGSCTTVEAPSALPSVVEAAAEAIDGCVRARCWLATAVDGGAVRLWQGRWHEGAWGAVWRDEFGHVDGVGGAVGSVWALGLV